MRSSFLLAAALVAIGCGSSDDSTTPDMVDTGVVDSVASGDSASADSTSDSSATDSSTTETSSDTGSPGDTGPDAAGTFCGGIAGKTCPTNYFCEMATGMCKVLDAGGTCTLMPTGCTKELNPVCGCDGETYDNPCLAKKAGVSVDHTGACTTAGKTCGGKLGVTCSATEYCDYPPAAMCGAADGTGTCTARPSICPGVVSPVCGCNGMTYNNTCEAHRAGVDDLHAGACP